MKRTKAALVLIALTLLMTSCLGGTKRDPNTTDKIVGEYDRTSNVAGVLVTNHIVVHEGCVKQEDATWACNQYEVVDNSK